VSQLASDLEFYRSNGFLPPFPLLTAGEVEQLLELVPLPAANAASTAAAEDAPPLPISFGARDGVHESTPLLAWLNRPALLDRLQGLMGAEVCVWHTRMWVKSAPKSGQIGAITWHADLPTWIESGWIRREIPSVSLWIALTDMRDDPGSLMVVAGSHRQPRPTEALLGTDASDDELLAKIFAQTGRRYETLLDIPLQDEALLSAMGVAPQSAVRLRPVKGECILFDGNTWHGSNSTDRRTRIAIAVRTIRECDVADALLAKGAPVRLGALAV
jgi:hypothetical protein